MTGTKKLDFYADKPAALPRFVYRRLAQALSANPGGRTQAITAAISELLSSPHPDVRKFKFFIPDFLRRLLSPAEASRFDAELSARREHARRLKMVFPHVGDEFQLDAEFLSSVLDLGSGPEIKPPARFFTVGSCFARNIATYLVSVGHDAKTFELAEDINSPISNAFVFNLIQRAPQAQTEILVRWIKSIFPELSEAEVADAAETQLDRIRRLAEFLREADCVVLTLGNVVDFFRADADPSLPLLDKIFPKIVAMPANEDIAVRSSAASRLKSKGAVLRLATYGETLEAIKGCIGGIRALTQAPIVVTLSPVPIDSAIGLADGNLRSAIEVDCVSKSRLRSAYQDALPALQSAHSSIHYFPSFEIVRWVAPMLTMPSFGLDDAAARHVSSPILDAVCSLFLTRFVKLAGGEPLPLQSAKPLTSPAGGGLNSYQVTYGLAPTKSPAGL